MQSNNSAIALQSKEWLVQALLSLMKTESYHKITIKKICLQADLSRQTFYNLFNQKDDVLRFHFKEQYQITLDKYKALNNLKLQYMTDIFADFLESNHIFLHLMLNQGLHCILMEEISLAIPLFAAKITKHIADSHECSYVNAFMTGALTQILAYWMKDGQPLSKEELSRLLQKLLTGTYYELHHI